MWVCVVGKGGVVHDRSLDKVSRKEQTAVMIPMPFAAEKRQEFVPSISATDW